VKVQLIIFTAIIYPDNGEVLESATVEIKIKVDGFEIPSKLHTSIICVGLSSGNLC
jgi:hypothetical protein